jgi:hypothetical protein
MYPFIVDFSKAFDTVNHPLLCLRLGRIYGFSGSAVSFIESYLSGHFQCVCAEWSSTGIYFGSSLVFFIY